jgi:hypothetical protein
MAKTKVSEWSAIPANNTDVGGIDINEGCAPSGINNAIRDVMAQIKDMQTGADGDNFVVGGNLTVTGTSTFAITPSFPAGAGLVPSGCILMWSGSIASIPSGWLLCDGTNLTPDLRNLFVVGAGSTYAVGATGGSANAIVVAHTHTGTTSTAGNHNHATNISLDTVGGSIVSWGSQQFDNNSMIFTQDAGNHNHTFTTNSTGSSGTNANLPPYYALAYIMKA